MYVIWEVAEAGNQNYLLWRCKNAMNLILEYHNENQASIAAKIWSAFEKYRGKAVGMDDFELITFKIKEE